MPLLHPRVGWVRFLLVPETPYLSSLVRLLCGWDDPVTAMLLSWAAVLSVFVSVDLSFRKDLVQLLNSLKEVVAITIVVLNYAPW